MLSQLVRLVMPRVERERAHALYITLVDQARNPFFYERGGVPDTLDGRFELIVLHLFLVLDRLKAEPTAEHERVGQELLEVFFDDMDRSLREIGVGDMGIGRRITRMADALYGRIGAYEQAIGEAAATEDALRRNLYGTAQSVSDTAIAAMVDYLVKSRETLATQPVAQLIDGQVHFSIIR